LLIFEATEGGAILVPIKNPKSTIANHQSMGALPPKSQIFSRFTEKICRVLRILLKISTCKTSPLLEISPRLDESSWFQHRECDPDEPP
jgi:hypothetical protein